MKLKIIVALLLGALTISVSANTYTGQNQFYIGAAAGYGGMITYQPSLPAKIDANNSYTAYKLRDGAAYRANIGYLWSFGHNKYGIELGYMGYPKNTYSIDNVNPSLVYKGYTADALLVFQHDYSNGWFIAGKLGAAYVTQQLQNPQGVDLTDSNGQSYFGTEHKVLPEVALTAGYNITQHVGVDISANYVFAGTKKQDLANAINHASNARRVASVAAGFVGLYVRF
jgi:hypothetical protein